MLSCQKTSASLQALPNLSATLSYQEMVWYTSSRLISESMTAFRDLISFEMFIANAKPQLYGL